ncbi:hypothetical protein JXO59_09205 [candidate division KSB1 bacterium]|nr:hypothetical protein [candidate division KSB1 bacterium]
MFKRIISSIPLFRVAVAFFPLLVAHSVWADSFQVVALSDSAGIGAKAMVLLVWKEAKDAEGFNVYRKDAATASYSKSPVNSAPIRLITDCEAIKRIMPERSEEWEQLSALLQAGLGGSRSSKFRVPGIERRKTYTPCDIGSVSKESSPYQQIQMLAQRYYKVALILGQGYIDRPLTTGSTYWYQIKALRGRREEIVASDIRVVAGVKTLLPAPADVQVTAGDGRVMVTWDSVHNAIGYDVFRRRLPFMLPAIQVNEGVVTTLLTHDLEGDTIIAPRYGMVDFQRYNEAGYPTTHEVNGANVSGPANGVQYQYQVSARNMLGTPGQKSGFSATAKPEDKTPPGLPTDLKVEAVGQTLKITWSQVTLDQMGHVEVAGIKGYDIYRASTVSAIPVTKLNPVIIPQPSLPSQKVEYVDSDPAIISHYGEKEFYYRIRCYDMKNNAGAISAAASGHVDDIYPPDPPDNVDAEGHNTYIRVFWDLNSEPDIESYLIYRSLCHYGRWLPPEQEKRTGIDCGPFVLISEITHTAAKDSASRYGRACFNDLTVPAGSPICYAYWVKAKDKSQNQSGDWPYPNPVKEKTICQRLRDETPPPPPIVSALQARDNEIYIEWVDAPCQDLGAFHVYRAEQETGTYKWVGGVTVVEPPALPVYLTAPFKPAMPCGCDSIPLVPHEGMKSGSFTDKQADPNTIYWYRVTSVDQNGNEHDPQKSVPYSTFTFRSLGAAKPTIILPIGKVATGCGLELKWTPMYNAAEHMGFVVYRSDSETGIYRQISPILQTNTYIDDTIHASVTYWYKIQAFDKLGRTSQLSAPASAIF